MKRTLLTALLLAPLATLPAAETNAAKPNIVCILADDLGWADTTLSMGSLLNLEIRQQTHNQETRP